MRVKLAVLIVAAFALPAPAHEMWLQPSTYQVAPGQALAVKFLVGEAADVTPWPFRWDKLVSFKSYGPRGIADQQAGIPVTSATAPERATVRLTGPGTHIVALESYQQPHEMEAAAFNAYLIEDGLTAAVAHRRAEGLEGAAGREIYSRRTKALIQVGAAVTDNVVQPIGQTLEIVPERNPYAPGANTRLPVRVLYQGRVLPGVLVALTPLGVGSRPVQTVTTGADGRAVFDVARRGAWMISVVWTRPIPGNKIADYDTIFSSLTFGYSG